MLIIGLSTITACEGSIRSVEPPILSPPPVSFTIPCVGPVELLDESLTQWQVEKLWIKDRANLIACSESFLALLNFYMLRDNGITQ